jgi:hypothetical protein
MEKTNELQCQAGLFCSSAQYRCQNESRWEKHGVFITAFRYPHCPQPTTVCGSQ